MQHHALQPLMARWALCVRRYTPRNELCRALMGQMRRQMHIMSGGQLAVVLRAMATAQRCARVSVGGGACAGARPIGAA